MNKKIVRADIAADLYKMYGDQIGKEESARIVDRVILKIKNELTDGNTIELRGFGSFVLKKRTGRIGVKNPRTGETINVLPHYAVVFKPGAELKKTMREIRKDL